MTGPRLAADVLAPRIDPPEFSDDIVEMLLAGADMVALIRTDAGVEIREMELVTDLYDHMADAVFDAYRLVDAPVSAQEDDRD